MVEAVPDATDIALIGLVKSAFFLQDTVWE